MAPQKIETSDGQVMSIDGEVISKVSAVFKEMTETCDGDGGDVGDAGEGDQAKPILFQTIDKHTWDLVMAWATGHANDTAADKIDWDSIPRAERAEKMSDFDKEFMGRLTQDELVDILNAANFLEIDKLVEVCCQKTILNIRGKKVEEIREFLGLPNDLTAADLEQIKAENKWLDDRKVRD